MQLRKRGLNEGREDFPSFSFGKRKERGNKETTGEGRTHLRMDRSEDGRKNCIHLFLYLILKRKDGGTNLRRKYFMLQSRNEGSKEGRMEGRKKGRN